MYYKIEKGLFLWIKCNEVLQFTKYMIHSCRQVVPELIRSLFQTPFDINSPRSILDKIYNLFSIKIIKNYY